MSQRKHRRIAAKYGAVFKYHWMRESGTELARITALIEAGEIKAVINSQFLLEDTPAAFARSASGQAGGKIIVMINGGDSRTQALPPAGCRLLSKPPQRLGVASLRSVAARPRVHCGATPGARRPQPLCHKC